MIALGVVPGIRRLSYCVLEYDGRRNRWKPLDADVWSGTRLVKNVALTITVAESVKLFRNHHKLLDVVWQRYWPHVLVIAPRLGKEPVEYAEAASAVLTAIATSHRVPVQRADAVTIVTALGVSSLSKIGPVVSSRLTESLGDENRHLVMAAAAAMSCRPAA